MTKDTTDNAAFMSHALGDLDDVDSAVAPTVDLSHLAYNLAGTEWRVLAPAAAEAAVATADATDLASAVALANANKAKINALLVKLRAQGMLLP